MRATRILIGLLVLVLLIAGGVYLFRLPLAGMAVRAGMGAMGLDNPRARVTELSLEHIALADLAAGPKGREGFVFDAAEATFKWSTLLFERRVETVRAGPGRARLVLSPEGAFSLPGYTPAPQEGGPLPFSTLGLADITLAVDTPEGRATGAVSADYDVAKGGAAAFRMQAERAGLEALAVESAAADFSVAFSEDGSVALEGDLTGDVISAQGSLRDVNLAITGAGGSWKDVAAGDRDAFAGEATVALRSATAPVAEIPALANLGDGRAALIFGAPVSALEASGRLKLARTGDSVSVFLDGAPLALAADSGATLTVEGLYDDALFERDAAGGKVGFAYSVQGALVSVTGTLNAETTEDGWFVLTPVQVGEYRSEAVSVDDSSAIFRINSRPGGLSADITTSTTLRDLSIGRFNIQGAPFSTRFLADADLVANRTSIELPEGDCMKLESGRFTLAQQDIAAALNDANLCAADAPLAVIDWSNDLYTEFSAALAAAGARFSMGETHFHGRPPTLTLAGTYRPAINRTAVSGEVAGGSVEMNEAFALSSADGRFDVVLDREDLSGTARFIDLQVAQMGDAPLIAPLHVGGGAALKDGEATFSYTVRTPTGERLGSGEGIHDTATATGQSTFALEPLQFTTYGLQPNKIAPVLKGLIGAASGGATGSADIAWGPSGLTSSADVALMDITFVGPTRIVTQTKGVNGAVRFSSLVPLATDGAQTITVDGVNLDALQLDQGSITFAMPGDETVRIETAKLNWFGGEIGVSDATISMAGGESRALLQVENIDLKQVFIYAAVKGLSGEGLLSGALPLVIEEGRAKIVNGELHSVGPGKISYVGDSADAAAEAAVRQGGEAARIPFDFLRDLRYKTVEITITGALDGQLDFGLTFEGSGDVTLGEQSVEDVPVLYRISLSVEDMDLIRQVSRLRLQAIKQEIENMLSGAR